MQYRGAEIESLRGRVGYMMQKDLLFPWRTVLGNVLLGLETRGVDKVEAGRQGPRISQRVRPLRLRECLSENPVRAACGSAWR